MSYFPSYWKWLLRGSGGKPGYRRFVNWWVLIHLGVGVVLAWAVRVDVHSAAQTVLLPLAGVLVGLSFAWAGNAQAMLQSKEIEKLSEHHKGGFVEYVFVYQSAILAILGTMVLWGLTGLHVFDIPLPHPLNTWGSYLLKTCLYTCSSITVRECWHVVMGAQWLLLAQREVKRHTEDTSPEEEPGCENSESDGSDAGTR